MKSLVLERTRTLTVRDYPISEKVGPTDLRIEIRRVGICGSDVHYCEKGAIGPYVVREPMILGHEASGVVVEVGSSAKRFESGDRVCMEPGVPDPRCRCARLGMYSLDPAVRI